ncbi:MAG: hypothetical protein M1828_002489 [Chrysothrix sp. TS-e1954]|nr:MAG: hypothetical protein M1828_002489 [Chrysothrix sp. TS-e1954]
MTNFNYTKRKSEGLKLGQIVAKDLRKRLKPATLTKSETHRDAAALDLNVEGKSLADDGIEELACGLEDVLQTDQPNCATRLQVLNVSQNNLSVKGLAKLAPSIIAAAPYLEELDLSGNHVSVATSEDCEQWETFLRSFRRCKALLRLNLSGNNLQGNKALELLARVYSDQYAYNITLWDLEAASQKLANGHCDWNGTTNGLSKLSLSDENISPSATLPSMRHSTSNVTIVGLPGVPIIDLSTTSITDQGALFLSYVIDRHRWLRTTLLEHAWGPNDSNIVTQPNGNMSPQALRLLSLVGTRSDGDEEDDDDRSLPDEDLESSPLSKYDLSTGKRDPRRKSSMGLHRRRPSDSISTIEVSSTKSSIHGVQTSTQEIVALRNKIQRNIIENAGVESVALWSTALRYLKYVRRIFVRPEAMVDERRTPVVSRKPSSTHDSEAFPPLPPVPATYASKLTLDTTADGKGTVMSPRTPAMPRVLKIGGRRTETSPQDSAYFESSRSFSVSSHLNTRLPLATRRADDTEQSVIGPLPRKAWELIIAHVADGPCILSHHHREAIMNYGESRRTLATEAEFRGNPDNVQIWRVLEAMSCLDYDTGL